MKRSISNPHFHKFHTKNKEKKQIVKQSNSFLMKTLGDPIWKDICEYNESIERNNAPKNRNFGCLLPLILFVVGTILVIMFAPKSPSLEEEHLAITQNGLYDTFMEIPEPIKGGGGEGLALLMRSDLEAKKHQYGEDCIYHYKTGECAHWDYYLYLASKGHPKTEKCPLCK